MTLRSYTLALAAGCVLLTFAVPRAQQINPPVTPAPSPGASVTPAGSPGVSASPSPGSSPAPTPPPIVLQPAGGQVAVGATQVVHYGSAMGPVQIATAPAGVVNAQIDQTSQTITLQGLAPGTATVTITDQRGISATLPVRVAYLAGTLAPQTAIRITGDPADASFVKEQALKAALGLVQARPGAQVVASADQIDAHSLEPDNIAGVTVPILIQGEQYFSVDSATAVRVENIAAPKIRPHTLMVSDFPEKLTQNGVLFAADLQHATPSRFLYFHYNPPGEPARRLVLRLQNLSREPAVLQYISGVGGPDPNEMAAGHAATAEFLKHLANNEGIVTTIPGSATVQLATQDLPERDIACAMLQLRVLNGAAVHMTLFAQNASSAIDEPVANETLLNGDHPHARGIYTIPEFHHTRQWSVNDEFLELQIGQIPLPNTLQGEALAGDYGVLESFVVKVENPNPQPAAVAIYENPRGGRATGTYLIDNVLIQSHQVAPFSRFKLRQYVVPARGFLRITIETVPDSGSSYPLRLVLAPDDGSVAPGAPGSPVY